MDEMLAVKPSEKPHLEKGVPRHEPPPSLDRGGQEGLPMSLLAHVQTSPVKKGEKATWIIYAATQTKEDEEGEAIE
jgi:hypothetical protein